jgi:hypothetical protein
MSHAYPPTATRLPLRVELFLLAHNDAGEPLVHLPSLCLGLAGAILAGLTLPAERVRTTTTHLVVCDHERVGDPVADWAATALAALGRPLTVRAAVRHLALDAYQRVTAELLAGGLVHQVTRRRLLGRTVAYPLTNPALISRVRGRLRYIVQGLEPPDPQADTLAGLIHALGLEPELYFDELTDDLRGVLHQMCTRVGGIYPDVKTIIDATEKVLGDTVVSVYR